MRRTNRQRRTAFTLVEVIAAAAIMSTLALASFSLVRTSHTAWQRHRDDSNQRREATATLQHLTRRIRQATRVTAISSAADVSGALTVVMPSGSAAIWDHSSATNQMLYGTTTANNLLAAGITEFHVVGLQADGSTTTTQTDLIHAVRCTVRYTLARPTGTTTETLASTAWLRAW